MVKYKENGNKDERISLRCTKHDKRKLQKRADALEMGLTEYVHKTLFPRVSDKKNFGEVIELIVEMQDLAVYICDRHNDDGIQEEMDLIWKKIQKLL